MPTVVVDSKGRVTIPAELREALGVKPGTLLEAAVEDGALVLRPIRRLRARDLLGAAGRERVELREVEEALGETT